MKPKSEHALLVQEGMIEYWRKPGVVERRRLQAKIREREVQLARLERHGMAHSDRYAHILSKLELARELLEQL